jgi:hypothetical protein
MDLWYRYTDLRKVGPPNSQELRRNGAGTGALSIIPLHSGGARGAPTACFELRATAYGVST